MAVLRNTVATTMTLLAGCYSPELRDCVIACARHTDCVPGQVCGDDGRCAAPELAGTCGTSAIIPDAGVGADAAMPGPDASPDASTPDAPPDAPPPPDAPTTITLTVMMSGQGSITVSGVGTCGVSIAPCSYQVMPGVSHMFTATPAGEWSFDRWQSTACAGQDATCTYTPNVATTVHAKFRNEDDD